MKARLMEVTIRPTRCMVCVDESGVRRRILIAPDGEVESSKGNFVVDAEAAELVLAAFEARGILLVIDYEHQTLGGEFSSPTGKAPAAGWITALTYEPGYGIVADVDWNQEAQEELRKKEYRYVSPVASIRKDDRRMVELHSVGLTNVPAIRRMEAIAAKDQLPAKESETMGSDKKSTKKQVNQDGAEGAESPDQLVGELKAALKAKGMEVADGASREDILRLAIKQIEGVSDEETSADTEVAANVRAMLGLPGDAHKAAVLEAMSKRVPATEYEKLKADVARLEQAEDVRKADEQVNALIACGKILETDREQITWARELAQNSADVLEMATKHWPDKRPPQGRTVAPATRPAGQADNEELMINKALEDNGGNHGKALVALQTRLIGEQEAAGLNKKAARQRCETLYPTIFS